MSEWQPIETATLSDLRSANSVLLYGKKFGTAFGKVYSDGEGGFFAVLDGYHGDWEPTHWMPLPEPPK